MRRRIVRLAVLSAALSLLLFGVPLATGLSYYVRLRDRDDLTRLAYAVASAAPDNVSSRLKLTEPPHVGRAYRVGLYDRGARLVSGQYDPGTSDLVRAALLGQASTRTVGGQLTVVIPVRDGSVVVGAVVATSRAGDATEILRGWVLLIDLAVLVLIVTWMLARRYARRVATPLEQLAVQADRLATGTAPTEDATAGIEEVDAVHAAMVRAAGRLHVVLEREREFSTVASHQLRTPLMRLSLALEDALEADDPQAEINRALAIVAHLDSTVTDVLQLARGDAAVETLDLDRLFGDIASRWEATVHDPDRSLSLVREADVPAVRTSGRAVRQVLDVLVDNAVVHGLGAVTVAARDAHGALAIDVVQEGTASEESAQALLAGGPGLGVRYARSIALAHGARLIVSGTDPVAVTLIVPPGSSTDQ